MDEGAAQPRTRHRADIQGLRAVAIVLVVVAHSGLALQGGFVGVDVFFVISGFVIGQLLLRELTAGDGISLATFYARRARRLLPALTVAIVVSIAVGILVLSPRIAQPPAFATAAWASVFAANGYLYRHLGYFDASADATNPFLHLWSLSVEEQFYVILPALLLVVWRLAGWVAPTRRRGLVVAAVAVTSATSLWLSCAMTSGHSPVALQAPVRFAFYSSPTRLWELGAGVLLAAATTGRRGLPQLARRGRGALAVVGVLAVAGAAALTDPQAPFPGLRAVPPVLGTVLILLAGSWTGPQPAITRALEVAPMRWIGDRSYTWYLWHWPFIVYARALWRGSDLAPVLAAAVSLPVAALAYAAFEDRIRRDRSLLGARALRLGASCIVVSLLASLLALRGADGGWGVPYPAAWGAQSAGRGAGCLIINRDLANSWDGARCTAEPLGGAARGSLMVLGDDHASSMSTAVVREGRRRGLRVAQWARSGCPFVAAVPDHYPRCAEWQREALDLVARLHPSVVVIADRSTDYVDEVGGMAAWEAATRAMVRRLADQGVGVVLVGGPPTYPDSFPVPSLLRPGTTPPVVPRAQVDAVHGPVASAERRALAGLPAAYVDPIPLLCGRSCSPVVRGRWRYLDAYDLNRYGVALLEPAVQRALDEVMLGG